jgi:hypothetical protein
MTGSVAAVPCAHSSLAFAGPFRNACRHEDERVGQGQDPAVRSLRRRHRRIAHRGCAARPQRAGPVRLPGPHRGRSLSRDELLLPPSAFVDVEAALEGAHRAESAIAEGRWAQAWGPAGIAYHVATRRFLTGLDAAWIDEWRRRLEEVRLRGLECFAAAGLGLGGPALAQAEERARLLTELAPYRETGHRILMEALERRGNLAEALRAYERLRVLLREELGVAPSPAVQAVHRRLLLQGADG